MPGLIGSRLVKPSINQSGCGPIRFSSTQLGS